MAEAQQQNHQLFNEVCWMLTPNDDGTFEFDDGAVDKTREKLGQLFGSTELFAATSSLLELAFVLEKDKKSSKAANAILECIEDRAVVSELRTMNAERVAEKAEAQQARKTQDKFNAFLDKEKAITSHAPTLKQSAPAGTVKLNTLFRQPVVK